MNIGVHGMEVDQPIPALLSLSHVLEQRLCWSFLMGSTPTLSHWYSMQFNDIQLLPFPGSLQEKQERLANCHHRRRNGYHENRFSENWLLLWLFVLFRIFCFPYTFVIQKLMKWHDAIHTHTTVFICLGQIRMASSCVVLTPMSSFAAMAVIEVSLSCDVFLAQKNYHLRIPFQYRPSIIWLRDISFSLFFLELCKHTETKRLN